MSISIMWRKKDELKVKDAWKKKPIFHKATRCCGYGVLFDVSEAPGKDVFSQSGRLSGTKRDSGNATTARP